MWGRYNLTRFHGDVTNKQRQASWRTADPFMNSGSMVTLTEQWVERKRWYNETARKRLLKPYPSELVGGWTTHLKNMLVKLEIFPEVRGGNSKKYLSCHHPVKFNSKFATEKLPGPKRKVVSSNKQPSFFRGYVKLRECHVYKVYKRLLGWWSQNHLMTQNRILFQSIKSCFKKTKRKRDVWHDITYHLDLPPTQ